MSHRTTSAKQRLLVCSGIFCFLISPTELCLGQAPLRSDWSQSQAQANDPALVRESGFKIQPPNQHPNQPGQGTVQPMVLSNGQRFFPTGTVSNATYQQPVSNLGEPNQAVQSVQPASWGLATPSANNPASSSSKSRSPLELRPSSKEKDGSLDKPSSTWGSAVSMFLSLAVVLSFFLLLAWLLKKAQPQSFLKLPSDIVQVLGRTPMAPRQQMYVVRFGSKLLLVSHQPGQTQTLCEITNEDEVQRLAGICEASHPASISSSFRDVLKQVASGKPEVEPKNAARLSRSQ